MVIEAGQDNNVLPGILPPESIEAAALLKDTPVNEAAEETKRQKFGFNSRKKFTSLYIDDNKLKLLTVTKKQAVSWAELPLEPGLVKEGVITSPAIMADKIKEFLLFQKVKGKNLIIGSSGLHCLSRVITLPLVRKEILDEAVLNEAKRKLPVPLEKVYITWQVLSKTTQELKVFLIAHSKNAADTLIQTLHEAGIKPHLMDLAPLAITRTVNEPTAGMVDVRQSEFDIVIMVNGVPELIRSLPLARDKSVSEKLLVISEELERTLNFYYSGNREAKSVKNLPLFISGELMDEPDFYPYLVDRFGAMVKNPLPPLVYSPELTPAHYMVNIGLVLKKVPLNNAGLSLVNLNTLPGKYRSKPLALSRILLALGASAAAVIIITMVSLVQDADQRIYSLKSELTGSSAALNQLLGVQKSLTESVNRLEKQVVQRSDTFKAVSAEQSRLNSQRDSMTGDLRLALDSLDSNISLLSLMQTGNALTLIGTALSEKEVFAYTRILVNSQRYSEVNITSITKNNENFDFTLTLKREV